jgi:molybdopterin-containing oxidoreductase family iron-sulfur binding subunit
MTDLEIRTGADGGADEKIYWRSVDQLANTERFQEILAREFPEGVSEHSGVLDDVSRRKFLGVVAASVALAGMTSCRKPAREILPFNKRPDGMVPGLPREYATSLTRDGFAFGVLVRSNDGRPTKIEGNPLHPSSLGGTDSMLQAEILNLYDPGRSKHVRQRGQAAPSHASDGHATAHGGAAEVGTDFAKFQGFWSEHVQALAAKEGQGLHVLMPPTTSPTLLRLVETMRQTLPKMRFHRYSATASETSVEAARAVTGKAVLPQFDFTKADVVASFDSDFLGTDAPSLGWVRSWAKSRKIASRDGKVSRLYVAEATHTLTGSNADHRRRMSSGEVTAGLLALAAKMNVGGPSMNQPLARFTAPLFAADGTGKWLESLAADLTAAGPRGLVVVGPRQPLVAHAIAWAINSHLGSIGATKAMSAIEASEGVERRSTFGDLAELAAAMKSGQVDTLICLGTNPVYDAPADFGFSDAYAKIPNTIHSGLWFDETAQASSWHIPMSHELEQWGDASAWDGTQSVIQPLIAPLHDATRSPIEMLAALLGDNREAYEIVRENWRERRAGSDFESFWRKSLHDGVVAGRGVDVGVSIDLLAVRSALDGYSSPASPSKDSLEVVFRPCSKIWDGRYSNNAWQQEVPSAIERMTWDNAVFTSRKTAEDLGVSNGDVVKLTLDGRSVEGPIWIQPGHADYCVTLTFGYGRRLDAHCEVAQGRGFDVFPVRPSNAPWTARGARAERTGRTYELVVTQEHGTMEGRALVREKSLDQFKSSDWKAVDDSPLAKVAKLHGHEEKDVLKSLWTERDYSTGYRWGMVIDLSSCTGCGACVTACVAENNIPMVGKEQVATNREMFWNRIDRYFEGVEKKSGLLTIHEPSDEPRVVYQMVPCMQCENAPCESVCPVAATVHSPEGLNDMVYNRCIGTRYCSNNCPYKVRRFNWFNFNKDHSPERKLQFNPEVTVRARGVMEKCTYCVQRINSGKFKAKSEGRKLRDLVDVRTACQQVCPAEAITFGDLNDPDSAVAKLSNSDLNYAMLSELNVKPRTTYLAKIRNTKTENA